MATTTTTQVVAQLRTMLTLTNTEIQIAQARQAQARTGAVRDELAQNGRNAVDRAGAIRTELRRLGGIPDVVSPALGRVGALLTTVAAQAEPLAGALLDDLAVEHQLADRARYLKALATAADETQTVRLADRLITAHDATVEWLTTVLAEEALGGPAALRATPLQAATGTAARVAGAPARWSAAGLNRAVATLRRTRGTVTETADELRERGTRIAGDAVETITAGRNASLAKAEEIATREGDADAAEAVHTARANTGSLEAAELPITGYDELSVSDAVAAVKELDTTADVRAVMAYEEAHKNRRGVVSASQTRAAAIAKEVVGIS
ncbi:hypothetical protein GCM10027047_19310 [Rhodococcus aerolatus]